MAANVAASATMNIQMPSLRDGTPNGEGSLATVSSATDRQECEQVDPEDGHEVPVERGGLEGCRCQYSAGQPALYIEQPAQTAEDVQRVQRGEQVQEGAARTAGDEQVLRGELAPGQDLAEDEQQSQHECGVQRSHGLPAPRDLERHAAHEQRQRVQIEQRRQLEMLPVRRAALPHDQRTREG